MKNKEIEFEEVVQRVKTINDRLCADGADWGDVEKFWDKVFEKCKSAGLEKKKKYQPKKTYVLIVSTHFPKTHKRAGEFTDFINGILDEIKKHTIRMNYELWKKRVEEINAGKAVLSVRAWDGKPYRSKQTEYIEFSKMGIQKLERNILGWFIDDVDSFVSTKELAKNDGLEYEDFKDWFKKIPQEPMAILHFTDFRY